MESRYWQATMDLYKRCRAECAARHLDMAEGMYGRAEMLARAEIEMSEAVEAVERKASR